MKRTVLICCLLILVAPNAPAQQKKFPKLTGPYLGQKPPGITPEIFAPGLVSLAAYYECCRAISPDGKEFFFVREHEGGDKIFRMSEEKDGWTKPVPIPYSDKAFQYTPFISPAGDKFLFMAGESRPIRGSTGSLPEVWILTRSGNDWTAPHLVGTSIGGARPFYITMTRSGSLYFSCVDRDGIYRSEFKEGKYSPAERLPDEINYLERVSHPFIAPGEDFIIVDARNEAANHGGDLYISFRKKDGTWTKAVNMGEKINSSAYEMCPSGLQGQKTDIYWVSSKIIEELRPKELKQ
jgi:hypothetical protein